VHSKRTMKDSNRAKEMEAVGPAPGTPPADKGGGDEAPELWSLLAFGIIKKNIFFCV